MCLCLNLSVPTVLARRVSYRSHRVRQKVGVGVGDGESRGLLSVVHQGSRGRRRDRGPDQTRRDHDPGPTDFETDTPRAEEVQT